MVKNKVSIVILGQTHNKTKMKVPYQMIVKGGKNYIKITFLLHM
jgi:hypothetical protein